MGRFMLQICASMSGALATFTTGQLMGWASPSIPFLQSNSSTIDGGVSSAQASWIASLVMIGNLFGIFTVVFLADQLGRKKTTLLSTIPVFCSWILLYTARRLEFIYVARVVAGFGETLGKTSMFMYVGEISDASIRGALGTFLVITLNSGILFEYTIGPFVSFENLALISSTIPILLFSTFIFMPESPYFLLLKGQDKQAELNLRRLRCTTDVSQEIDSIKSIIEKRLSKIDEFKSLFFNSKNRNTLALMCILFASQELSGITPNIMYAENILKDSNLDFISPNVAPIIFPTVKIIATLLTTILVDNSGRRPLFMISTLFCSISMTCIAVYFYFQDTLDQDMSNLDWLPLIILAVYNFMFIIGLGCLPFIMVGELFHTNIKAVAVSITAMCSPISGVFSTKMFQVLGDHIGTFAPFTFFAICSFLCFLFVTFFLPETKKQTLVEIQQKR